MLRTSRRRSRNLILQWRKIEIALWSSHDGLSDIRLGQLNRKGSHCRSSLPLLDLGRQLMLTAAREPNENQKLGETIRPGKRR